MLLRKSILAITLIGTSLAVSAQQPSISEIINRLSTLPAYQADVRLSVAMPQLPEDIRYDIQLQQAAAPSDTLMPIEYTIRWSTSTADKDIRGFSAYFSGHHYRFSGQRLQEYHAEVDPSPFNTIESGRRSNKGVHRSAQFVDILPEEIAQKLQTMVSDSVYRVRFTADTIVGGEPMIAVTSIMSIGGQTAQEAEYLFDRQTLMPRRIELENNPGSISEQSLYVDYVKSSYEPVMPLSEQQLAEAYPDAFTRMRQSDFRIENLVGTQLPAFALPTITGERFSREASDRLASPTVIALLDIDAGFSPDVVNDLRQASEMLPFQPRIIYAFLDNHIDRIEAITGPQRLGEEILVNAAPLIRDCGAANLPSLVFVAPSGQVEDIIVGYNKDLPDSVIQKMTAIASRK